MPSKFYAPRHDPYVSDDTSYVYSRGQPAWWRRTRKRYRAQVDAVRVGSGVALLERASAPSRPVQKRAVISGPA